MQNGRSIIMNSRNNDIAMQMLREAFPKMIEMSIYAKNTTDEMVNDSVKMNAV